MRNKLPTDRHVAAAQKRIRGHLVETPVFSAGVLDDIAGAKILVKAECLQTTGSFKLRGATNRLLQIPRKRHASGVVAFSSGNHAQGVARAARRLGMPALIVMPSDAPEVKIEGVQNDGAEVRLYDRASENREEIAAQIATERGAVLVPSFDDPMIIAGQGTLGLEFAAQARKRGETLDHLICCTGGGGLISGIALGLEKASPDTRIWSAEPEGHDDWKRSLEAGSIQENAPGTRSACDAILTPRPGELTWSIAGPRLAGGCAVSDEHAFEAMRIAFRQMRIVVEPGGAVALAAALFRLPEEARGKTVGVVVTGGNVDPRRFADILSRNA